MVPRLFGSPRIRRRAATVGLVLAAASALALLATLLPHGNEAARVERVAAPAGGAAAAPTPAQPKTVPLARADRRAIDRALDRFVPAAVDRRDPGLAFDLVTPALRAGTTRAEWATGSIPVQPFPARGRRFHHWSLSYSYRNHVGLELLLKSRRDAAIGGIAFAVDLKRMHGRWLVDSFIPAAVFTGGGEPPRITSALDFGPTGGTKAPDSGRLRPIWFLVPASILLLALAALIAYGVRNWLRGRRAVRAYEASRDDARKLPPLPAPTRSRVAIAREHRDAA